MNITEVKIRQDQLIQQLVEIWQQSVRQTHLFLSDSEINNIKKYVPLALAQVEHLIIATDDYNTPVAFMGIQGKKLEMLFLSPDVIGTGLGKALINKAITEYSINEVTVNEQNTKAKGFYEHIGFTTYKRTPLDEQGNPYPILYMKLN